MSDSKVRISNPQALNGESFYIDGILYTITDFRWDGGWESGEFKGYLTTDIPQPDSSITIVEIFFFVNTIENTLKLNTDLDPNSSITLDLFTDWLKTRSAFIHTPLQYGIEEMVELDSNFSKIIKSSPNYSGHLF